MEMYALALFRVGSKTVLHFPQNLHFFLVIYDFDFWSKIGGGWSEAPIFDVRGLRGRTISCTPGNVSCMNSNSLFTTVFKNRQWAFRNRGYCPTTYMMLLAMTALFSFLWKRTPPVKSNACSRFPPLIQPTLPFESMFGTILRQKT